MLKVWEALNSLTNGCGEPWIEVMCWFLLGFSDIGSDLGRGWQALAEVVVSGEAMRDVR